MSNEKLQTVDKPKAPEAQSYNPQKPRIADETLSGAVVELENIKNADLKSVKDPIKNGSDISDKTKESSTGSTMRAFQSFLKKVETVINKVATETLSVKTELDERPKNEYSVSTSLAEVEDLKIISTPLTSVSFSEDYVSAAAFLNSSRGTLQNGTIKPTDIAFKDVNITSQVFAENSNLQKAENLGEWLDNWYGSSNEKALLKLIENSKNVGSSLKNLPVSRANVTSTNTMLTSLDNAFGWNLGKNTGQLLESKSVSYETHLKNLELTVDPTDRNESWGDFFKKVFSKNTLKEIGSTFTDAAVEFGLSFIRSLIPSVISNNTEDSKWESDFGKIQTSGAEDSKWKDDFKKQQDPTSEKPSLKIFLNGQTLKTEDGDFETYREAYFINPKQTEPPSKTTVPDFISFLHGKGTKKIALNSSVEESKDKYNSLDQDATTTSMALLSLLGIDFSRESKSSTDKDVAKVLHDFVAKNPLLGQHQYTLRISKPKSKVGNNISEDLYNEFIFRVKNIDFPTYQRTTANTSYGHSGMTLLTSLQATVKHEAVLNIICDRNFDVLEYLIRLTGLGICTTGELPTNETDLKKTTRIYNLSTVADSSYTDELGTATLRILNGRDLLKANNMMNRETDYSKTEPTAINLGFDDVPGASRSLVTYGKLPVFLLENFKFVNLDYPLNFDSTKIDSKLLEIKATVTWTKASIKWEEAGDPFYSSPESESDDKANT